MKRVRTKGDSGAAAGKAGSTATPHGRKGN